MDTIAFDPESPTAGETLQISATVRAGGDTFTHVAVEFWDGDPARGGRYLAGRMIPMILAGQNATVGIEWDTAGLLGQHDIWVAIQTDADEHTSVDNRTYKTLNLEPRRIFLPTVVSSP